MGDLPEKKRMGPRVIFLRVVEETKGEKMKKTFLAILLQISWLSVAWFIIFKIDIPYEALQVLCWFGYLWLFYHLSKFAVHYLTSEDRKDDVND